MLRKTENYVETQPQPGTTDYTQIGSTDAEPPDSGANDNRSGQARRDILAKRRRRWTRMSVR